MRWVLAVLFSGFLATAVVAGQKMSENPEVTGSFAALSVKDLDVSMAWYRDLLGFHVENLNASDERAAALMMRGSALVELAQFFDAESSTAIDRYLEHGIFKLGFQVRDIDATFERLEQNDVEVFFPIVELRQNRRTFAVKDPDGNIVQFFGP